MDIDSESRESLDAKVTKLAFVTVEMPAHEAFGRPIMSADRMLRTLTFWARTVRESKCRDVIIDRHLNMRQLGIGWRNGDVVQPILNFIGSGDR